MVDLARSLAPSGDDRAVVRVVVKVRFAPFSTETHGAALARADTDPEAIVAAAEVALERFVRRRPVRLVGVRVEYATQSTVDIHERVAVPIRRRVDGRFASVGRNGGTPRGGRA